MLGLPKWPLIVGKWKRVALQSDDTNRGDSTGVELSERVMIGEPLP